MPRSQDKGIIQLKVTNPDGIDALRAKIHEYTTKKLPQVQRGSSAERIYEATRVGLDKIIEESTTNTDGISHALLQVHLKLTSPRQSLSRPEQDKAMELITEIVLPLMKRERAKSSSTTQRSR